MENGSGPRKRGRPRKSLEGQTDDDATQTRGPTNDENVNPKKRGRPGKSQDKEAESSDRAQKRRREDPQQMIEAPNHAPRPASKTSNTKKPAAKSAKSAVPPPSQTEDGGSPGTNVRRSARDRRSADSNLFWARGTGDGSPPETNRSGREERSSLGSVSAAGAQINPTPPEVEKAGRKKRGPPQRPSDPEPEATSSRRAGQRSRKGPNQAESENGGNKEKDARRKYDERNSSKEKPPKKTEAKKPGVRDSAPAPAAPTSMRQRRSGPQAGEGNANEQPNQEKEADEAPQPQPKPRPKPAIKEVSKYRHLAPKTRQIPRSTIALKWSPLDDASIAAVDDIISDAYRPVLLRLRDRDHRREQAETILHAFARRLHSKLKKGLPFPPPSTKGTNSSAVAGTGTSHEADLDFDRVMGSIQALEATLDPLLHSVALLAKEKEKEEAALAADYKLLRRLKGNLKDENRKWIEHGKREHALVPDRRLDSDGNGFDERELLGASRAVTIDGLELVKKPVGEGEEQGAGRVFKVWFSFSSCSRWVESLLTDT